MKLCQSISYLSYQVIVWITFLHLSVVSLCQLVKSPGGSIFQVYLISLLLIVIEISISSAWCCLFFFFFSFFLVIWAYQFSGVFCLGAKVAQTFLWMELLCNHRDQLQTPDCSPLTTTQELQIWDVYASLKCLGISVQYLCMTPVWYRSAIATMTVTVTSL